MLTISLTHHPHARKELLLEKSLRVVSRSGLNPTERTLLERLPTVVPSLQFTNPLFLGGRTGALAMAVWLRGQAQGTLSVHTFDAHTASVLQRNLETNHAPMVTKDSGAVGFAIETSLDMHAYSCADTVFWQMTKGDGTAELHLFLLETLADTVAPVGRRFYIAAEELNETFLTRFKKYCGKVSLTRQGEVTLLTGELVHPLNAEQLPNHRAEFEVSLKGHDPIKLVTWPGCFCHRRADMGGLALTEVVAEQVAFDVGDRVMDMGCGCGMDGILLAAAFPEKELRIDYQDSNASARDSVEDNVRRYPHAAKVIFSAEGEGDAGVYDLFLSNPPYFGDWRIAEFFVQTAARILKKGGILAFVSKREAKPLELMTAAGFDLLGTFSRRGYIVLLAARR